MVQITPAHGILETVTPSNKGGKVLRMVENERTAGAMPAWVSPQSQTEKITANMAHLAVNPSENDFSAQLSAYQDTNTQKETTDKPFGFFDLIDIINPLQHIPLVNLAYRAITGDEIRPALQIVGGAIFGGPLGAASGLINAMVEDQTGQSLAENALNFTKTPPTKAEQEQIAYQDLPASLLAFTASPKTI